MKRRFSDDPFCDEVHVDIDRQALRSVVVIAGNRAIECGNLVRAEEILESSLDRFLRQDDVIEYNLACAASLMGKLEKSMAMLRLAVQHGYNNLNHLRTDPDLAAVRAHPQFRTLVEPLRTAAAPAATSAPIAATMIQPAVNSPPMEPAPVPAPVAAPQPAAPAVAPVLVSAVPADTPAVVAPFAVRVAPVTPVPVIPVSATNDERTLMSIFPNLTLAECRTALQHASGSVAIAVNNLLGSV